jgi:hypothetical protein
MVEPGRVVGLGAVCDLGPSRPEGNRSQSFRVGEFVTLADGRRVMLHEERGFTIGPGSSGAPDVGGGSETVESLTRDVLNVVLPDDDDCAEPHPWSSLAGLARARGLEVTEDDLRALPYEVVLTDAVTGWLTP